MPKSPRRLLGFAVLAIGVALPLVKAPAQAEDPARVALAKTYLEVSKQIITTQQLTDIVVSTLTQLNPDLKDQISKAAA